LHARLAVASAALVLIGLNPGASYAAHTRAGGQLKFHAKVSGKTHDSGTITASIQSSAGGGMDDFNGCAIVTQGAAKGILGAQTLEIHLNYAGGTNLLNGGVAPFVPQEIYMQLSRYRPSVSTYAKSSDGPVNLAFAMNGHVYGQPSRTIAHVQNGGRTGTVTGLDAQRFYPGTRLHLLQGLTLQVSWNCSTMLHRKG
jgi:hypothetical protein